MSLKNYLIIIAICSGLSWLAWLIVLITMNPFTTPWLSLGLFYISLFIAVLGTASLIGFGVRYYSQKEELWYKQLNKASRQGAIVSVLIVLAVVMQSYRFLSWWNILILAILAALAELLISSYKRV